MSVTHIPARNVLGCDVIGCGATADDTTQGWAIVSIEPLRSGDAASAWDVCPECARQHIRSLFLSPHPVAAESEADHA